MLPLFMPAIRSPQRIGIPGALKIALFLLGISIFINYIDRSNLSIAAPMLKDEFGISSSQLGLLLSAFFWTYASFQLISGWLVDRLNVNWVFAAGFFLWSAATAGTGIVHAFSALFALRLLLGVGESVAYPSYSKIIALNFPEEHRGFANAVISAGLLLGPGFGLLLGGMLMARFGWRSFFIALGVISMLWLLPWLRWMPKKQLAPHAETTAAPSLPEFLRLRSAWGTCLGQFGINYVSYFLLTWLPYYLQRERHFSITEVAKIGGIAYLLGACSTTLAGLAFRPLDHLRRHRHSRSQNFCRRRPCPLRTLRRPLRLHHTHILCCRPHPRRRFFWCRRFQCLGNHANPRRPSGRRTLDWLPEFCR